MKDFKNYQSEKYTQSHYYEVEDGIYKTKSPYNISNQDIFVTSLSFEMEPECYGEENGSPRNITQVPFEELLDTFQVFVTDFYEELNAKSESVCYQEFGSFYLTDIQKLRSIIGKRVYAIPYIDEDDGEEYYDTVFE